MRRLNTYQSRLACVPCCLFLGASVTVWQLLKERQRHQEKWIKKLKNKWHQGPNVCTSYKIIENVTIFLLKSHRIKLWQHFNLITFYWTHTVMRECATLNVVLQAFQKSENTMTGLVLWCCRVLWSFKLPAIRLGPYCFFLDLSGGLECQQGSWNSNKRGLQLNHSQKTKSISFNFGKKNATPMCDFVMLVEDYVCDICNRNTTMLCM